MCSGATVRLRGRWGGEAQEGAVQMDVFLCRWPFVTWPCTPSTLSSPSRCRRRPASRSPALSADSVLENVKSDFAREDVFFCCWQTGEGADDAQTVQLSACLFLCNGTQALLCARVSEGVHVRPASSWVTQRHQSCQCICTASWNRWHAVLISECADPHRATIRSFFFSFFGGGGWFTKKNKNSTPWHFHMNKNVAYLIQSLCNRRK